MLGRWLRWCALGAFCVAPAWSADRFWNDPAGGLFNDPAKWLNGVPPTASDAAIFNLPNTYTVTLNGNFTNNRLVIRNGQPTFQALAGGTRTYTLTSTALHAIAIGDTAGNSVDFTLASGTLTTASGVSAVIATVVGSIATVNLTGSSAILNGTASTVVGAWGTGTLALSNGARLNPSGTPGNVVVGNFGTGELVVLSGATVRANLGRLGVAADSDGSATIDGANSSWICTGKLTVGENGMGSLTVQNGGLVRANGIAIALADVGIVELTGGAKLESTGSLSVGDALSANGGLNVFGGSTVTSASGVIAAGEGAGTVSVGEAGSRWTVAGPLEVARGGLGTLQVSAGGAVSAGSLLIGVNTDSDGLVDIGGPAASFSAGTGGITVASSGIGALAVHEGAWTGAGSAIVGEQAGGTGFVEIFDSGSTLVLSGGLTVGKSGSGDVNVSLGGVLSSGSTMIAQHGGSAGSVVISEAGAWTAAAVQIGVGGQGSLTVSTGGAVACTDLFIATASGSEGFLDLSDAGSRLTAGSLAVGGTATGPGGTGLATVSDGATLSVLSPIIVWPAGVLTLSDASVTAPRVQLSGGTLAGQGAVAPEVRCAGGILNVPAATLTINGPFVIDAASTATKTGDGLLSIAGPQAHGAASTFNVNAGSVELLTDGGTNLTINARNAGLKLRASQHLAALKLTSATATVAAAGDRVLSVASLVLDANSQLDLADNTLIVRATAQTREQVLADLHLALRRGRTGNPLTRWQGRSGIVSSQAASSANVHRALGAILNLRDGSTTVPLYASFRGESVGPNDVLVAYTWNGDTDLDGRIDADDYFRLDRGYFAFTHGQLASPTWHTGDFDYDGDIDINDYILIDSAFLAQGGTGGGQRHQAVPEPAALLVLLPVLAMSRRRR